MEHSFPFIDVTVPMRLSQRGDQPPQPNDDDPVPTPPQFPSDRIPSPTVSRCEGMSTSVLLGTTLGAVGRLIPSLSSPWADCTPIAAQTKVESGAALASATSAFPTVCGVAGCSVTIR